jgi:hypothetical protein
MYPKRERLHEALIIIKNMSDGVTPSEIDKVAFLAGYILAAMHQLFPEKAEGPDMDWAPGSVFYWKVSAFITDILKHAGGQQLIDAVLEQGKWNETSSLSSVQ